MHNKCLIFGIVALMSLVGFHGAVAGETFAVVNTSDSGDGSLRWAIEQANTHTGRDTIEFNIPYIDPGYDDIAGVWTIQPTSALPIIPRFNPLIIDGYTQPGAQRNTNPVKEGLNSVLKIELDGSHAGSGTHGLVITAGSTTVRGLVINRFDGHGILISTNQGSTIEGNYIGTDAKGLVNLGNRLSGVCMDNSIYNTVGPDNMLSFNGADGVSIEFRGMYGRNSVNGNMITDNLRDGIWIENVHDQTTIFTDNYMRGNSVGIHMIDSDGMPTIEDNLIEGNTEAGILIEDVEGTLRQEIQRNVISLNATGIYVRSQFPLHKSQYQSAMNITHNSIYSNSSYGLLNEDSTVTVDANDNWWGAGSGPYNEVTNPDGQGNAVAGNVVCDDWWSDILSISPVANVWDTAGSYVFVDFLIFNVDYNHHDFEMTVIDSLEWYCFPNEFSFHLKAMTGVTQTIMVIIPQEVEIGTENRIVLSGTSAHDPAIHGSGEARISVVEMVSVRGDVNVDGVVNILDSVRIVNIILRVGEPPTDVELWASDCNGDEHIDVLDLLGVVNVILGIGECTP